MSPAVVPFLIAAIIIPAALYFARKAEEKRKALARSVAASAGLQVSVEGKDPPDYDFDLFDRGRNRQVRYHMWPPGKNDGVFLYRYTTGSGDNKQTHEFTCALVELPFDSPHMQIGPEGFWSELGKRIGIHDIEVESPEFNDLYRVSCDDERFAITLLDQQMIGWMVEPISGRGSIRFELLHNALLCISGELPIDQMPGFLGWAQGVRTQLPQVLPSLYPLSP